MSAYGSNFTFRIRLQRAMAAVGMICALSLGCTQHSRGPVAAAPCDAEPPTNEVSRRHTVPASWIDFGVDPAAASQDGARAIDTSPSRGRFPTGLAIVRLSAVEDQIDRQRGVEFVPIDPERCIQWNHFVDDLPPIREVTMLRTLGIDPRGSTWQDFLYEARQMECGLCLMYTPVYESMADAEFAAVLWDAAQRSPLATFRASFVMPDALREACEKRRDLSRRECDPEYLAEARLRTLVSEQLWDLAARDGRVAATRPSPWRNNLPLYPRDVPRYRDAYWMDMNRFYMPVPPQLAPPESGAPDNLAVPPQGEMPSDEHSLAPDSDDDASADADETAYDDAQP